MEFDLPAIDVHQWQLLRQSEKSYKAPFHSGVVATVHEQLPQLRTVILRKVDIAARTLFFHTDIRSPKVEQLKKQPAISWLFYDADLRVQLRMQATATIHYANDVANVAWEHARLSSRLTYTTSSAAGVVLPSPELIDLNRKEVEPELIEMAWRNFCVVETTVQKMDWMFLNKDGNRRALFDYHNNNYQWIQV
jgi:3-hydroxyisobutyrate dehydrogenase